MIWNPEYECMDRAALHELQLRRLQMTVVVGVRARRRTTARGWTSGACGRATSAPSTTCAACRSPTRAPCATPTRSACSPCRSTRSCASTPRRARPASRSSSATRAATSTRGPS